MSLLTSHSRKVTPLFSRSKTSLSKRKAKMLLRKFKINKQNPLFKPQLRSRVVLRARRRLLPSQLLKKRKLQARRLNLLMSERALTRLLNTLLTSHQAEKKPHKRANLPPLLASHQPRELPPVLRINSPLTHPPAERSQPRPLIK